MKVTGEPGWLVTHRPASLIHKNILPLSALIMNFPMIQNKNPSLLSFNQVKSLFGKVNILTPGLIINILLYIFYKFSVWSFIAKCSLSSTLC